MEQEGDITDRHEDLITMMPELIQDKIFGFLGFKDKMQTVLVCPSWRTALYRPCNWKEVKVRLRSNILSEEFLSSLVERKIRHVEVNDFQVKAETIDALCNWSGLISLQMNTYDLPFHVLQRVFCKDFLSQKMLQVWVTCKESGSFHEVFQHVPNLENLSLRTDKCGDLDEAIVRHLKGLKHLSLRFENSGEKCSVQSLGQLGSLHSLSFHSMTLSGMDSLNSSWKTLTKLELLRCDFGTTEWPEALSQMTSLVELSVISCQPEVHNGATNLSQRLKNLKKLKCSHCCGWPCGEMSTVQELSLIGFDFRGVLMEALSSDLKNLRSLMIERPRDVPYTFMIHLAGMSSLQEFSMSSSDIGGRGLERLNQGSCQLRKLELRWCKKIEGKDMKHVARMSSLRELHLSDMGLGSTGLSHLTQGTFKLESLNVSRCGFTREGLRLLLEKQQSLHHLLALDCVKTAEDGLDDQNWKERYEVFLLPHLRTCPEVEGTDTGKEKGRSSGTRKEGKKEGEKGEAGNGQSQ